ncbi:hypothetical protein Tco_0413744 [Tanacetum coccineum]
MEILPESTSNSSAVDALVTRTASAAAKPCQGDSFESYLIIGISDGVTTSFQQSQDSRPHAQSTKINT